MSGSNDVIVVTGLTKRYGASLAVDDVSFTVGEGEFYGFLGPNGAGKSTTVNMLATLVRPSHGEAFVAGSIYDRAPDHAVADEADTSRISRVHSSLHGFGKKARGGPHETVWLSMGRPVAGE